MKPLAIKIYWLLSSQFGLDPLKFVRSIRGLPAYRRDWLCFRRGFQGVLKVKPCLHDQCEEGGTTKSEYFWQDLLVARWIYEAKPRKHVDVGSRVDGFVAHVASFREIEVLDVRPITTSIPGVSFRQADLMSPDSVAGLTAGGEGYCDSLSCLHALEHFGLGRYGEPVDAAGYQRGLANLASLLLPQGILYLATPIGRERVEFNANWIFDPQTIIHEMKKNRLKPIRLLTISPYGKLSEPPLDKSSLDKLANNDYQLGVFTAVKEA